MAKKKASITYFEKHSKLLSNVVQSYRESAASYNLFATSDFAIFNSIENGITKHPLRYYQMDALFMLDYLLKCNNSKAEKKDLLEIVDEESDREAPFLSYEMATGSGKTMLMGASIYFLSQKYDINNFLIITPASTDIYQKTIRNFQIGNYDSVWADDTPFTFNLITGDNYSQNLFFDNSKDANIFIFNISKFGANAVNTELTWESAVWHDQKGNNISIKQFLKDKRLIVITDEAHHAQTKVASKIIRNFHPEAVLEFTATAIENEKGFDKKNQTIIYKYDIRRFLEDGHGKLVRAVALATGNKAKQKEVSDNEKLKIITLFLIHLLKKEAVLLDPKSKNLKPVAFVKVKNETSYTQKVFNYIKNELASDVDNINIILEKVKAQDLEITTLLTDIYKEKYQGKIKLLRGDIHKAASTAIFYYGQSDKETEKKFLNIRKNEVEIVVYMQRLDEGIDLPNIFSMAVINDTETDFKTSVKQIIGRGVRLNKDKREFDNENDKLKANSEMLHIVCDQGKNFEEVIVAIQQEFGLNNKYLSFDKVRKPIMNKAKSDLLTGKYIPHIKADLKAKQDVNLISLITNVQGITSKFVEDNCFEGENDTRKRFLKYRPEQFFLEVDIFSDKKVYHQQIKEKGGKAETLNITEREEKQIYYIVQKNLPCLPDTDTTRKAFVEYIEELNRYGLQYYKLDEADDKLASKLFVDAFSYYYRNKIEKDYFYLDFHQLDDVDSWSLKNEFRDYNLLIPEDQIDKNLFHKIDDKNRLINLIDGQYHFSGFKKSIYKYSQFDSYLEIQLAKYFDIILAKNGAKVVEFPNQGSYDVKPEEKDDTYVKKSIPFWVKNMRQIYFNYGSRKYYPDFILFYDDKIYVIEGKGEVFSDTMKNMLLKKLDDVPGDRNIDGFKGLIVFSNQMEKIENEIVEWNDFVKEAEESYMKMQTKEVLHPEPKDEEKFAKYVPAYSPMKAYKKFIKNQKTPKPDGWYKLEKNTKKLPDTIFATQVKGGALSPQYWHNNWILLDSEVKKADISGNIALVYCDEISDVYDGNCTIRKIELNEKKTKDKLFTEKEIILSPVNSADKPIIISNITSEDKVQIIGLEFNI